MTIIERIGRLRHKLLLLEIRRSMVYIDHPRAGYASDRLHHIGAALAAELSDWGL